jgi:Fe-S cluster biogenesis protein NfuA
MDIKEAVQEAIEQVRPALQADGGDVELVEVDGDVVKVRLTGACSNCPFAQITLKAGIESVIKKMVPEVSEVEAV